MAFEIKEFVDYDLKKALLSMGKKNDKAKKSKKKDVSNEKKDK